MFLQRVRRRTSDIVHRVKTCRNHFIKCALVLLGWYNGERIAEYSCRAHQLHGTASHQPGSTQLWERIPFGRGWLACLCLPQVMPQPPIIGRWPYSNRQITSADRNHGIKVFSFFLFPEIKSPSVEQFGKSFQSNVQTQVTSMRLLSETTNSPNFDALSGYTPSREFEKAV